MAERTNEIKGNPVDTALQERVQLFDKEFTALQHKYQLRAVAQVIFPGGAVLNVPIQVAPIAPMPVPASDQALTPDD